MKKVLGLIVLCGFLVSCEVTSTSENTMMLQNKFPKAVVYRVDGHRYIIADSVSVSDVRINNSGEIFSTVKIK